MTSPRILILLLMTSAISLPLLAVPTLTFSFRPEDLPEGSILESLLDGHRSEIRFEVRLYRNIKGFSKLFGDRLVSESFVLYEARRDAINDRYIVTIDREREIIFEHETAFTDFFFGLESYSLTLTDPAPEEIYVLCRAQVEPIKLVPPLTLLTLILPGYRYTTQWIPVTFRKHDQ